MVIEDAVVEDAVVVDWGELYRTALPDLVRFLHRKVWDMERAKDLAQDTFVRALLPSGGRYGSAIVG